MINQRSKILGGTKMRMYVFIPNIFDVVVDVWSASHWSASQWWLL